MSKSEARLICGDCREEMASIPSASVDAIISDPPYPEIDRDYGRLTEAEWWDLMMVVVAETRRVLKSSGSAVFVLQPNSRCVGSMRGWLWEFMAWACREWNQVQDCWWWNFAAPPTVHTHRDKGLMRPSLKAAVWLGPANCYRNQDAVLMTEAAATATDKRTERHELGYSPSGLSMRHGRALSTYRERGGVTPFNVLVAANSDSSNGAGTNGHGAGTPYDVADWWVRYISPPDGTVCDPFAGVGTIPLAALSRGRRVVAIERDPRYFATMERRISRPHLVVPRRAADGSVPPLFASLEATQP